MRSMSFQLSPADQKSASVVVTITENADGTLRFDLSQKAGSAGDLRGFFFDIGDESLIGSLRVSGASQGYAGNFQQGNDTVLGNASDDWVNGNQGNDSIGGGADNDWLYGGNDGDVVNGAGYNERNGAGPLPDPAPDG